MEPTNGGTNGISLQGPAGLSLQAKGAQTTLLIVIIAGFALVCSLLWSGFDQMAMAHKEIAASNNDLACVLALEQSQRIEAVKSGNVCKFVLAVTVKRPQ